MDAQCSSDQPPQRRVQRGADRPAEDAVMEKGCQRISALRAGCGRHASSPPSPSLMSYRPCGVGKCEQEVNASCSV